MYNHLMTFALNGHHSPEGQQLHAHRGDRVCQAHPVEDTQSGDQYVEVSPNLTNYGMHPLDNVKD